MSTPFVAILMGSENDLTIMKHTSDLLTQLEVPCEVKVTSAHRTPERTLHYVRDAEKRGCQIFICAAGLAAHLAGAVAAQTIKPVIGVPLEGGVMSGLDALLSTVQMPKGVPVATVAVGKHGAVNAALLAAQIIALQDSALSKRLFELRAFEAERVTQSDDAVAKLLKA